MLTRKQCSRINPEGIPGDYLPLSCRCHHVKRIAGLKLKYPHILPFATLLSVGWPCGLAGDSTKRVASFEMGIVEIRLLDEVLMSGYPDGQPTYTAE